MLVLGTMPWVLAGTCTHGQEGALGLAVWWLSEVGA